MKTPVEISEFLDQTLDWCAQSFEASLRREQTLALIGDRGEALADPDRFDAICDRAAPGFPGEASRGAPARARAAV
jgi:hypothetical protein